MTVTGWCREWFYQLCKFGLYNSCIALPLRKLRINVMTKDTMLGAEDNSFSTDSEGLKDVEVHYRGEETTNPEFYGRARLQWTIAGGKIRIQTVRYGITRKNVEGGNKANVIVYFNGTKYWEIDKARQDGQWHEWINWTEMPYSGSLKVEVEFIFDKSGNDPRRSAVFTI